MEKEVNASSIGIVMTCDKCKDGNLKYYKGYIPTKHLPLFTIVPGLIAGVAYGLYYGQDIFVHGVHGSTYGTSAIGIYDLGKSVTKATL